MREQSIPTEIIKRMSVEPNSIFTVDEFSDLSDNDSIRTILCRLAQENKIVRLIKGYFTIPYQLTLVDRVAYPSTQALAEKYAERHGWCILPTKETVLNMLGLSTQVPAVTEYISTGPNYKINYRGHTIRFRHTYQLILLQLPREQALIIQAIKEIGKDKITPKQFQQLCTYYKEHVNIELSKQPIKIPTWIKKVLRRIEDENHGKIDQSE